MMYYVYSLKGDKYYVGSTNDLDRRIKEHKRGCTKTINNKLGNFELIGYFEFNTEKEAREYEKQIKRAGHYDRLLHRSKFILKK